MQSPARLLRVCPSPWPVAKYTAAGALPRIIQSLAVLPLQGDLYSRRRVTTELQRDHQISQSIRHHRPQIQFSLELPFLYRLRGEPRKGPAAR